MKRRANLLILSALVTIICALTADKVAAQAIAVSPTDPTLSVGQTQQFTATGVDTATAIEAGAFHQCALLQDTTVRCWGLNDYGQLGNGTMSSPPEAPNPTPRPVVGLTGAAAIAGGGYHTCVRFPDGRLQCWGRNSEGQLGDPATTAFFSATPVPVTGITGATAVAGGGFHNCALLPNGTVQCWGLNDFGQLGNGAVAPTNVPNPTPVTVTGITTAIAISAGGWHSCALLSNGTVRCWGDNERGQIGDGTLVANPFVRRPTPNPVTVVGITTAVALKSGIFHTCALLQDGRVQCWGWNDFGQLGNDPPAGRASSTPVTVSGIASPAALAPGAEHSCVLLSGGTVRCWGDNTFGQVGNGSPRGQGPTNPGASAAVTGITTATGLTSGAEHTCALLPGGSVRCWGRGLFGRLGDGSSGPDAFIPVTVVGFGATWESSNPAVATIDAAGLATGRSPGTTTIRATSGSRSGSTTLTVVDGSPVQRFTLMVDRRGSGGGVVTSDDGSINCGGGGACSASYDSGTGVNLRATPTPGSTFGGWSGCDTVSGTTCTVTMSAARSVSATFVRLRFTLVVNREGNGIVTSDDGRINCGGGGECSASYDSGTQVTLRARPGLLSAFSGWSGGGCSGTGPCTLTLGANTTVIARFRLLGLL